MKLYVVIALTLMLFSVQCLISVEEKEAIKDQDLVINISDLAEDVSFFPVEIEGVQMEILAVKSYDKSIRIAFNTCEVCYPSGKGYFEQKGTVVVCQNCGNRYRMSQIGLEKGGCNPVPITAENRTDKEGKITIAAEFIAEYKYMFLNWKN